MPAKHHLRLAAWTLSTLLLLLAWDALGLDLPLARLTANASGFPLRDHWLMSAVLHDGARRLSWLLMAALTLAVWRPFGILRALKRGERIGVVVGTLLALLAVSALKSASRTSCPWDLVEFGGTVPYISHWAFGVTDGGGGRCFPAGHASAGFAFVPGYFWLREKAPRAARRWLIAAIAAGLGLGMVQQLRGAHYLSHTLWTAWVCWTTTYLAWVASLALETWNRRLAMLDAPA